jgi:conjugative transfer signal peptidase TraF
LITATLLAQLANGAGRLVLHNASPSEPEGVYVRTSEEPAVGRLVTFMAPASASSYVDGHLSYLRRTPILKVIAAGQGSFVCTTSGRLVIDRGVLAAVSVTDRHGVFLPQWKGCRRLGPGEWFAYSDRIPNSFDSRYYGPIRTEQVIAVYRPLWIGSEGAR